MALRLELYISTSSCRCWRSGPRLVGTVRDYQGGVLPGVTVTATSPSLIGLQAATSEGNGTYQYDALDPRSVQVGLRVEF